MIFLTGDKHANFDSVEDFCFKNKTSRGDLLIILGDAGINFYLNNKDRELKAELSLLPITLFCIHGNHEERPQKIDGYKNNLFCGGIVYYEEDFPNILFAEDGEIFDFNGLSTLVCGGAYSTDKELRLERGWPWFKSEQPDDAIKDHVEEALEKCNYKVDVVLTHTCPMRLRPTAFFSPGIKDNEVDNSTEKWLGRIEEAIDYKYWFAGHFHCDVKIDKCRFLFNDFIEFPRS